MSELKIGQKVFVPEKVNSVWTGEGVVEELYPASQSVSLLMTTGEMKGKRGGFDDDKVTVVESGIKILSLKRSTHRTGLKVYGKVLGESGKEYNVAYFRRPNFRGWICSCENFFFTMFAKKRNCKHLRFVRGQVGRFAASVK